MAGFRQHFERALSDPGEELSRWARFVRFQWTLYRFCARRLRENTVVAMSAALSFRTIFALIPVIVLAFLVLRSIGAVEDGKRSLHRFLDASGFSQIATVPEGPIVAADLEAEVTTQPADADPATQPAAADGPTPLVAAVEGEAPQLINVAEKIEEIATEVEGKLTFERLGPIGVALFIWTALTLLSTIEGSLNRIFNAPRSRVIGRRVLLYWSVLTLGPVALVVASYVGRQFTERFAEMPGIAWLFITFGWVGPVLVGVIVLAAVYSWLPNTTVPYRAAIGAAVIAVPIWLVAKWAFALYVQRLVVTGNLYGVLGLFPLFLMWLNLSWLIFLFGAELAHTLANLKRMALAEQAEQIELGPSDMLAAALAVAHSYVLGEGPVTLDQISDRLSLPSVSVQSLTDRLKGAGMFCDVTDSGGSAFVLARPADQIHVLDVLNLADPRGDERGAEHYDASLKQAVSLVRERARPALEDLFLTDMLQSATTSRAGDAAQLIPRA